MQKCLDELMEKGWIVYAKKPFAGPKKLLNYLARYTHKIAISNNRILNSDEESVTFSWRDYADKSRLKTMRLSGKEFMQRYLQHVVPKRFMRIRSFGFLANACKKEKLETIRVQLNYQAPKKTSKTAEELMHELAGIDITLCPCCKKGKLVMIRCIDKNFNRTIYDTS